MLGDSYFPFRQFDERSLKFHCHGAILNKNKIDDFKVCDKAALISEEGKLIWSDIESGKWIQDPSLLYRFFILSFAVNQSIQTQILVLIIDFLSQDLKSFNYYYWFAYPCPSEPLVTKSCDAKSISSEFTDDKFMSLTKLYFELPNCERSFFIVNHQMEYSKLSDKINLQKTGENFADDDLATLYFCFSDPCVNSDVAGWPLRLFVIALAHFWYALSLFYVVILLKFYLYSPKLRGRDIKVLSLRAKRAVSLESSVLFTIRLPEGVDVNSLKWIGWEPNTHGKYLPNCASMASSMDPLK